MKVISMEDIRMDKYLGFFGFKSDPFADNLNLDYYFKTEKNEQAYYKMLMCVEHNISLGLVVAESGMGKSLLGQKLLVNLNENQYQSALVLVTPEMSRTNFLKELCFELTGDENIFDVRDSHTIIKYLQNEVIDLYDKGKKTVIIIDEAHFLSSKSLHTLRTLSNIEVPERKLITCILLAEKSFLKRLKHNSYRSLDSRMYIREEITALSKEETEQYVKFRIAVAGGDVSIVEKEAYDIIYEKSGGICRKINKLMTIAFMQAFFAFKNTVSFDIIKGVEI